MEVLFKDTGSTSVVIGGLTDGITCFRVDTLPEVCTTLVFVLAIVSGNIVPEGYNIDVRVTTVFATDVSIFALVDILIDGVVPDVDISADVDANAWETVMAVFIALSSSLEELLLFSRTALCIAVLGCRPLQPWIPSNHVCGNFALPVAPQFPNQEPP